MSKQYTHDGLLDGWSPEDRRNDSNARHLSKLEALARILRGTDYALSLAKVGGLTIHMNGVAPGWTDGEVINISSRHLGNPFGGPQALAAWLGVNYHELGHVLFTPRMDSTLVRRIKAAQSVDPKLWQVFNMTEDQRQERLVIAKFSPLRAYLTVAIENLIVTTDRSKAAATWPLLCGRTWIPGPARAMARDAWVDEYDATSARRIAELVGEYQGLGDPAEGDAGRAFQILSDLSDLLHEYMGRNIPKGCGTPTPTEGTDQPTEADSPTAADDPEPGQGTPAPADEGEGEEGDGEEGDGAGEGDESDDEADGEAGAEGEGDSAEGDTDQGEGQGEGEGDTESDTEGDTPGDGAGGPDSVTEAMRDAVRDLLKDSDVREDLNQIRDAVTEETRPKVEGADAAVTQVTPTEGDLIARKMVAKGLRRIVEDVIPGWDRRVDSGKLNVGRYVRRQVWDPETMFDKFDHGQQDEVSLEVALLLDNSGSMGGEKIKAAAAAVWTIRHAIQQVGGKATVLTFNSSHRVVARPGDKVTGVIEQPETGGSTVPTSALVEARKQLLASESANRICILMTDGIWQGGDTEVARLREDGVLTVGVGLGTAIPYERGFDVTTQISTPTELGAVFARVATEMLKSSVSRARKGVR